MYTRERVNTHEGVVRTFITNIFLQVRYDKMSNEGESKAFDLKEVVNTLTATIQVVIRQAMEPMEERRNQKENLFMRSRNRRERTPVDESEDFN